MKIVILYFIFILFILFVKSDQLPTCTEGEQPILGDWGFKNIAKNQTSPWSIKSTENSRFYFCTDDECGSPRYSLKGYYYAYFAYNQKSNVTQTISLKQNFTLPDIPDYYPDIKQGYFLEYFLSSSFPSSNNNNLKSVFSVYIDDISISSSTGVMVYGDVQRVQLTPDPFKYNMTHTLEFQVSYTTTGPLSVDSLLENGFQLSSAIIRREPITASQIAMDMYVSIATGSDLNGNGTLEAPFSTIATAMIWITPNNTIFLLDGVYCGLAIQMNIYQDVTISAYNQSQVPNGVILSGEQTLSIFKMSSSSSDVYTYVQGITIGWAYSSSNTAGGGAVFIESQSIAIFSHCKFIDNVDYLNRGSISMRGSAHLVLLNSFIINCSCSITNDYGPAISMLGFNYYSPILEINLCQFESNQQSFLVDQTSDFSISNTIIKGIPKNTNPMCSMMISRVVNSTITNSTISDHGNCALCIIKSNTMIRDSTFTNNSLETGPGGNIYISQNSEVSLENVIIQESKGETGAAIFLMEYSTVNCINTSFYQIISSNSLISSSNSFINLQNSTIENCASDYSIYMFFGVLNISASDFQNLQGGMFATSTNIFLLGSTFQSISHIKTVPYPYTFQDCLIVVDQSLFSNQSGAIYLSYTTLNLDNSVVTSTDNSSNFIFISPLSTVVVNNSTFTENLSTIFAQESGSFLTVSDSNFNNNTNRNPSGAGSIVKLNENASASFTNSTFQSNYADNGGCFYLQSLSTLLLVNCTGFDNSALTGGIIYGYSNGPNITMIDGSYHDNHAATGGGVVYYTSPPPTSQGTVFTNNFASYGMEFATSPTTIMLDTGFPESFQSGITLFSGLVSIRDKTNQVVTNSTNYLKIYLQISGNTIVSSTVNSDGYATFTNVLLSGGVGSNVSVVFLSNQPYLSVYQTSSLVTPCPGGQIPSASGNLCVNCSSGSYGYDGRTCIQCPTNAYCQDGNQVIGKAGYWFDPEVFPISLYPCSNANNCQYNNTCAPNTQGILCAECKSGYYNWGSGCMICNKNSLFFIAVSIISPVMILWVQRSDSESGLMTVIVYFIQTLMVLSTGVHFSFLSLLNLQFESSNSKTSSTFFGLCPGPYDFYDRHYMTLFAAPYLIVVLILVAIATVLIKKIYHFIKSKLNSNYKSFEDEDEDEDEFEYENIDDNNNNNYQNIDDKTIKSQLNLPQTEDSIEYINKEILNDNQDDDDGAGNDGIQNLYNNNILLKETSKLNVSLSVGEDKKKKLVHIKRSFINQQLAALIKLILNIYSPIAKATFEMFFCQKISGVELLIVDNSVRCLGGQYHKALIVSYSLLAVIIGFPTILMIQLFKQRKSLDKPYVQRIYGVFILKYKDSFYFWDVILLARRLLIVLMSMMEPTSNERSFLLVLITLGSVLLQFKFQPFKSNADNQLEFTSLTLLFICCVYLDNNIWETIEQYVVIISSCLFATHAIYIVYSSYRHDLIDRFLHYLYIISSGKHGRKQITQPKKSIRRSSEINNGSDVNKPLLFSNSKSNNYNGENRLDKSEFDSDDDLDLILDDPSNTYNNSIEFQNKI